MTTIDETLTTKINQGLKAGLLEAIATAKRTGTNILISDANGNPIEVTPVEAEALLKSPNTYPAARVPVR